MRSYILLLAGALTSISTLAEARGPEVARHLIGYQCMGLNLTREQMLSSSNVPSVLAQPRPDAPQLGEASASIIVVAPLRIVNGYAETLYFNGQPGWIAANMIKPWASASMPRAKCIPALMADGKPGFDYR